MGAAEQRQKSSKMAADLVKKGIWHGRRMTKPCHANYPKPNEVGSAAYRRLLAKGMKANQDENYTNDWTVVAGTNKKVRQS